MNGWHDDNKGDSGIVLSTIQLFKKYRPNAEYSVVSTFAERHEAFRNAYRHVLEHFPGVKIVGSPFPYHAPTSVFGRYGEAMAWSFRMIPSLLALACKYKTKSFRAIADANVVISKGGHIFYTRSAGPRDVLHLLKHLYPLIIAYRFGVPYVIFGQSLGPFNGFFGRLLARRVLNRASRVFVREQISCDVALDLGISPERVAVVPDAAFGLQPKTSARVATVLRLNNLDKESFCVITVRHWPPENSVAATVQKSEFIRRMESLVRAIVADGFVRRVVIVVHTGGPLVVEDDRIPSRLLFASLQDLSSRVTLLDEDFSPSELVALYGRANVLIGCRFHSVIFALTAGTAAVGISYFGPKARGIMRLMGIERYCLDIADFDDKEALRMARELDSADIKEKIRSEVQRLTAKLDPSIIEILKSCRSGE